MKTHAISTAGAVLLPPSDRAPTEDPKIRDLKVKDMKISDLEIDETAMATNSCGAAPPTVA
ncbi:MAG: hypothetical protein FWD68_01865 [Alphaproteobacteria bacterium]|nr:hypothetical protein [Alphaproteobacteria bacterium]